MYRVLVAILGIVLLSSVASAQTVTCTNSYSGTQTKTFTLPPGTQYAGRNQLDYIRTDAASAQGDIGKTFYTPELTTFSDATCASGPCNHSIPGIAHRSWPLGACVAVCNLNTKDCAISVVMDRGPNTALKCRAIDGNVALKQKLKLTGITPATYQLLKLTGPCDTGGPVSIPTPSPAPSTSTSAPGPGTSLVGTPTPVGQPAQSAYVQPANYSNYQPSQVGQTPAGAGSTGSASPYFTGTNYSQMPLTSGSTIYASSSTADLLLNLLTTASPTLATTSLAHVIVDIHEKKAALSASTSSQGQWSTSTPRTSQPVSQTFTSPDLNTSLPQVPARDFSALVSSIVLQLTRILDGLRSLFSR